MNDFMTVTQASERLNKSRQAIYDWLADGRFPGKQKMGGMVLIPIGEIEAVRKQEAEVLVNEIRALGYAVIISENGNE